MISIEVGKDACMVGRFHECQKDGGSLPSNYVKLTVPATPYMGDCKMSSSKIDGA